MQQSMRVAFRLVILRRCTQNVIFVRVQYPMVVRM